MTQPSRPQRANVKQSPAPVWCKRCKRTPTWSVSGVCRRCTTEPESGAASPPSRTRGSLGDFGVTPPWRPTLFFATTVSGALLCIGLLVTALLNPRVAAGPLLAMLILVGIAGLFATGGFLLALTISKPPFYLPMRAHLHRAAWTAGSLTVPVCVVIIPLLSGCLWSANLAQIAFSVGVIALFAGGVVSGIVLEAVHKRAAATIAQGDACFSCGHLLHGSTLDLCPECGGPLLRGTGSGMARATCRAQPTSTATAP